MYLFKESEMYEFKKANSVYRALNHPLRQRLLFEIDQAGDRGMKVTPLYCKLRIEQSVCSQHLAILRDSGLVKTIRDGKFINYLVNHKRIEDLKEITSKLIKH